jgi:type VI secretion system protein ImpC
VARLPYGPGTIEAETFSYSEAPIVGYEDGKPTPGPLWHDQYCYSNAAYAYASLACQAFDHTGLFMATRGVEGGGLITDLPFHTYRDKAGREAAKTPTEVAIPNRREHELSRLGLLTLQHIVGTDKAVIMSGSSANRPKKYDDAKVTKNAALAAQFPIVMSISRLMAYLNVMATDKVGSLTSLVDVNQSISDWITEYRTADANPSAYEKARYPIRDAQVQVTESPESLGWFRVTAQLCLWSTLDRMSASMQVVSEIPGKAS